MKVSQFVKGRNFHVDWHFKFWEEKLVKNLVNCQHLLFTGDIQSLVANLCKISWEKHPGAFVKVVEGSEMYNFAIHHLVHFSCKNSS
jgi:hypothetical protein